MKSIIKRISLFSIIVFAVFALFGCGEIELTVPQNIKYDGNTVSWDPVENAQYYSVCTNGTTYYNVNSCTYAYMTFEPTVTIKVKAVAEDKDKKFESEEGSATFTQLGKVTNIKADSEGVVTWDVVPNATGYKVKVINGSSTTEHDVTSTMFDGLKEGENQVQVKAVVQNNFSFFSNYGDVKKVKILETVKQDSIRYENGKISWDYISGAQYYEVKINGNVVSEKNNSTNFAYDAQNANFEVTIRALGNGSSSYNGKESEAKKFIFLDTVTNIHIEDGIVKWNEIAGADGYKIRINDVVYNQTLTSNEYKGIPAGTNVEIEVLPVSNDNTYFSNWSASINIRILQSPVLLWNSEYELDGQANSNLYWDGVQGAEGYEVRVTDPSGKVTVDSFGYTQRFYQHSYDMVGTYTVEVKALASTTDSNINDSAYSTKMTIIRLAAPERVATDFIKSNDSDVDQGFTVTFKSVAGATGYKLYKDNVQVLFSSNTTQFKVNDVADKKITDEQHYNYKIQSIGYVDQYSSTVYLSSLTSNSLSFEITVLPTPSNPTISGYEFTFGLVNGANGYSIDVSGSKNTSGNGSYNLDNVLEAGKHQISVCAKGNGTNVLASNYTPAITIHRLDAPQGVKIETSEASEGVLKYDEVNYATGYQIVFDHIDQPVPVTTMMNINSYITEQGTTVYMQSIANYFNSLGTEYYMTSQPGSTYNFIKLAAPTFGDKAFNDTQLIWKAPSNINTSQYTPTYEVYNANGIAYNGEKNGTAMDITYLEGGQTYAFSIKAIGNGTQFINSQKSTTVTVYKLADVEISRVNGAYTWGGVVNATSYQVYVDGELAETYRHEPGKTYSYVPNFTKIGTYNVTVYAIGDTGYTSVNSTGRSILQETKQLTTPEFSYKYSHDKYDTNGEIQVTITKESQYAKGYAYIIGGKSYESTESTYSLNPNGIGEFTIAAYALGGNFDENGVYYLDSQTYGSANTKITILAYPNADSFKLSEDGYLTWATINGCNDGYYLTIAINGVEQAPVHVTTAAYLINGLKKGDTVDVKLYAGGKGKVVSSADVEYSFDF